MIAASPRNLASVLHCLKHYLPADEERRYGLDHEGVAVPFEYTCAYLVGVDCRRFLNSPVVEAVRPLLARFDGPDAEVVGIVVREIGRSVVEPEHRNDIFECFRWLRRGAHL